MCDKNLDKSIALIGFAVKAGKVVYGLDSIARNVKRVQAIIFDQSLAANSQNKAVLLCQKQSIPYAKLDKLIEDIVFKVNCKIIGITDIEFANAIINYLKPV